ncbi:hypothetical protein BBBOND_0104720 [Babesia bigemina]|uniref:Uncharacterized protein n=1 Tax=Babesia bigemina TaxID=5866 RepID=A0A061D0G4_BABBI|nr:hypothetical protein BBBOND_0104720 [Babesia bigemina]CDR94163.1 hypothetical protein BBBOND_0104720 [Babesia bigemina]|eukprot:XP_012766349.1 hypothetical protein BBBOND_0104720 [Babesia bigemina]
MAVSAAENEQTYQAVSDSTDCNSHAKHNEDGNEGMLMDISEMKATVEDKMETRESLQDINEMKATVEDKMETRESLQDINEMKATVEDKMETRESLQDISEMKATVEDKMETRESLQDINEMKATVEDKMETRESLQDISEMKATVEDKMETRESLQDINEMKATVEDKMETRESLQDINEMKATVEDKMETRESLQDMREMMKLLKDMREMMKSLKDMRETMESLKDMREMMESLKDMRETKEIAETMKSLVDLLQRGLLHKYVVAPCVLKTPHPDGGAGTSPSGSGQQQLCSAPPQSQHASSQAQSVNIPETCVVKKSPNLTAHQQVVYNSLIYVPRNFKEAVDWLIAVRGDDGMKNLKALGAALYDFYAHMSGRFTEVSDLDKVIRVSREFLEQEKLKKRRSVKRILIKLNDRLRKTPDQLAKRIGSAHDTKNEKYLQKKGLTADTIAENLCCVVDACAEFLGRIKNRSHYKSAYSPQATWDASFSAHPETGVVIFVGIAPMLCASISSLNAAVFAAMLRFPPFIAYKRMQELIQALGYVEPECRAGMTASYVGDALEGFEETIIFLYELAGFWIFY